MSELTGTARIKAAKKESMAAAAAVARATRGDDHDAYTAARQHLNYAKARTAVVTALDAEGSLSYDQRVALTNLLEEG